MLSLVVQQWCYTERSKLYDILEGNSTYDQIKTNGKAVDPSNEGKTRKRKGRRPSGKGRRKKRNTWGITTKTKMKKRIKERKKRMNERKQGKKKNKQKEEGRQKKINEG